MNTSELPENIMVAADAGLPVDFLNLLSALMRQPSVVGAEHSFFRVLQRELEERGAQVTWYEGVLVAQKGRSDQLFLSAHIDRHGLICTGPNEFQFAAFVSGARSDLLGNSVSEQLMLKVVDRFDDEKVYAYEPWSGAYLGQSVVEEAYICEFRNNLIFTLKGMEHLVAGTPVAFRDNLKVTDKALIGQLDNVLTAAVLVYLFGLGFEGTAFFTAQEEAGKSWRYLLEWFRRFGGSTNQLIVVDTSPFSSYREATKQHLVLRNKDANAGFSETMTSSLAEQCEQLGLVTQYKDEYVEQQNQKLAQTGQDLMSLGSTEMGRIIQASNGLVRGTTLQIPTSNYHTLSETAPIESVAAFIKVLMSLSGLNVDDLNSGSTL